VITLSTEDAGRAPSWNIPIAGTLIPAEIAFNDGDGARHYHHQGGLHIDHGTGTIRWHAEKIFGDQASHTVRFIRAAQRRFHGVEYSKAEESKTRRVAYAEWLRELLAEATPLTESDDGGRYLESRGLPGPWPIELLWHPHVRTGEGAILAPLTSLGHGRVTGYLVTYVTPLATKSLIKPPRIRLNFEQASDAVMVIADREPGYTDIITDTVVCEGLENGLSLARVKRPGWRILALAGILTGVNFTPARSGERIIFFQDSDPEGHPARDDLQRVIDALKDTGAKVSCTKASPLGDANVILQHEEGGEAEQTRLIETAAMAPFSFARQAERLAQLPRTEYEKARKRIAKEQDVRVGVLDREVALRRAKPAGGDEVTTGGWAALPEYLPWDGPDPQLATVLDTASVEMAKFVVAPKPYFDIAVLWAAVSHLVQSEEIGLPIMPQLGVQSEGPESGKSTLLECVSTLAYRGVLRSSYTGATLFRRINEQQVTYCLSDLHTILTDPRSEIHAVIKACHRRAEAFVDRTEENSGGGRYVATYKCWAALAWSSIGPMTSEMHGRAILLALKPALPEESRGLDHASPSQSNVLIDCHRQIAACCTKIHALPEPEMPAELYSRSADNFRPLLALTELVGGDWPQRARAGIAEVRKVERRLDLRERLLTALRDAFDARARNDTVKAASEAGKHPPDDAALAAVSARPDTRIATIPDLLNTLNDDEESGLGEANHGRAITAYWLRDNLHGLLDPPGSQEWYVGEGRTRKHIRGYEWHQLVDACRRYRILAEGGSRSGASGTSVATPASAAGLAEISCPGCDPDGPASAASGSHPGQEISRDAAPFSEIAADDPDAPDAEPPLRGDTSPAVCEGRWGGANPSRSSGSGRNPSLGARAAGTYQAPSQGAAEQAASRAAADRSRRVRHRGTARDDPPAATR